MKHARGRLALLVVLALALAVALPDSAEAASFHETNKLTASDAQANDGLGRSVAISGDTAVVGARFENAGGTNAGAAYIFQHSQGGAGNWGQVSKLTASDAQAGDAFGRSVAVSGDTAIVGAFAEDAGGSGTGAAYVFQRDEGGTDNWGELKKLTASDAEAEDYFGYSVAVSGDTAVVSADWEDAGGADAGAAYVFQRDEGGRDNWGEVKKLTASDAEAEDHFGFSVAVSGDAAVVGAILEDSLGPNGGAAYVFQRDQGGAGNWGEVKKLTASDAQTEDEFGASVAVSGDTALVATNLEDAGGFRAGAAYVFQRDQGGAGNWGEVKKLVASDAQTGADFGGSASVSGDTAVIGAFSEEIGGDRAGAAYVFQRDQGSQDNWGEVKKLTASDARDGDYFGGSVAVSGDTAVVGARFEDAAATKRRRGLRVRPAAAQARRRRQLRWHGRRHRRCANPAVHGGPLGLAGLPRCC